MRFKQNRRYKFVYNMISVFNMITRKNESKTLTKHTSCEFKCKFNARKCQKLKSKVE